MMMTVDSFDALLASHAPVTGISRCPELVAHQAADVFALWQELEHLRGQKLSDVPFWALVWPAAGALARWLLDNPEMVRGRRVLEIGSGGAIASIAAARAGAQIVVANDIDPDCEVVARSNAAANGVKITCDTADRISSGDTMGADVVLVADSFYERTVAQRTMQTLHRASSDGAKVLIADSGRPFAPDRKMLDVLWQAQHPANEEVEGVSTRTVLIGQLRSPPP